MAAATHANEAAAVEAEKLDSDTDAAAQWEHNFTLLWIDLLENHGQAMETVSQMATQLKTGDAIATIADGIGIGSYGDGCTNSYHNDSNDEDLSGVFIIDTSADKEKQQREAAVATLQESMQNVSNLLSSVEEIIRERLLGTAAEDRAAAAATVASAGKEMVTAALPSPFSARSVKQQQPAQNSLDAYLNGVALEEDPAFVNSVCGWDTSSTPLQVKASVPEVILLEGVELHDVMMQNNVRHYAPGRPIAHSAIQTCARSSHGQAHVLPASAHRSLSSKPTHAASAKVSEKKGKKRKLSSVTVSTAQQADTPKQYAETRNQTPHRYVRQKIADLIAEKVLMHRDGNKLCSYLMKYTGQDEPIWVLRKQCAPQAQQKIDEYNKRRLAATRRVNRQRAEDAAERLQSSNGVTTVDSDTDEGDIYIVDKIVSHRMRYGKKQYFVKWDGYDSSDNTWEAASKLQDDVADVVEAYERKLALAEKQDPPVPTELSTEWSLSNSGQTGTSNHGGHGKNKHRRHASDIVNKQRRHKHRAVMVKSALGVADDEESDADVEILSGNDNDVGGDSDGHSTIDLESEIVIVDSDDSGLSD